MCQTERQQQNQNESKLVPQQKAKPQQQKTEWKVVGANDKAKHQELVEATEATQQDGMPTKQTMLDDAGDWREVRERSTAKNPQIPQNGSHITVLNGFKMLVEGGKPRGQSSKQHIQTCPGTCGETGGNKNDHHPQICQ